MTLFVKKCDRLLRTWLWVWVFLGVGCRPQYVIPPDGEYDYRVPVASGEAGKAFEKLRTYTVKVTWSSSYKVYHYNHDFVSDTGIRLKRPLLDSTSVTGYRLAKRDGIWTTEDTFAKVGTGLVVAREPVWASPGMQWQPSRLLIW